MLTHTVNAELCRDCAPRLKTSSEFLQGNRDPADAHSTTSQQRWHFQAPECAAAPIDSTMQYTPIFSQAHTPFSSQHTSKSSSKSLPPSSLSSASFVAAARAAARAAVRPPGALPPAAAAPAVPVLPLLLCLIAIFFRRSVQQGKAQRVTHAGTCNSSNKKTPLLYRTFWQAVIGGGRQRHTQS